MYFLIPLNNQFHSICKPSFWDSIYINPFMVYHKKSNNLTTKFVSFLRMASTSSCRRQLHCPRSMNLKSSSTNFKTPHKQLTNRKLQPMPETNPSSTLLNCQNCTKTRVFWIVLWTNRIPLLSTKILSCRNKHFR